MFKTKTTIESLAELKGMIKILVSQYNLHNRDLSDAYLTFEVKNNYVGSQTDWKFDGFVVKLEWIAESKLVHVDPETSHMEYDHINDCKDLIVKPDSSLTVLEENVFEVLDNIKLK